MPRYKLARHFILWGPFALICACSQPAVRVRTVEVVKEVQRPCAVTKPVRPAPIGPLPADAVQLAAVLGAKLIEFAGPGGYAERAERALTICTEVTP